MSSSTDFKQLFDKYQSGGAPNGLSIVKYCQMNGVVLPVQVVDGDGLLKASESEEEVSSLTLTITHVNLEFSNGLQVTHHNLSYQGLCRMIEKLEVLC